MSFAVRAMGGGTPLAVTIASGATVTQNATFYVFGTNTATVTGGNAPYTYQWHESDDSSGTWYTPGTTAGQQISVTGVYGSPGEPVSSIAHYYCVVTDASGNTATSGSSIYQFTSY